jgi:hypothetical protein
MCDRGRPHRRLRPGETREAGTNYLRQTKVVGTGEESERLIVAQPNAASKDTA